MTSMEIYYCNQIKRCMVARTCQVDQWHQWYTHTHTHTHTQTQTHTHTHKHKHTHTYRKTGVPAAWIQVSLVSVRPGNINGAGNKSTHVHLVKLSFCVVQINK